MSLQKNPPTPLSMLACSKIFVSLSSVSLSVVFKFFSVRSLYSEDLRRRPSALGVDDLVQGLMEVSLCKTSCCLRVSKPFPVKELK